MKPSNGKALSVKYGSVPRSAVPRSRNGKHHDVVRDILADLVKLPGERALKIPLEELHSKEKVRSALNRETRKRGMEVQTASDQLYLYVWKRSAATQA